MRKQGAHSYLGLRNDRSKRQLSKLYKGIKKNNLTEAFELMEKENKTPSWEKEFDTLIGRPVSGQLIKEFIRNLLKQKENDLDKKI